MKIIERHNIVIDMQELDEFRAELTHELEGIAELLKYAYTDEEMANAISERVKICEEKVQSFYNWSE